MRRKVARAAAIVYLIAAFAQPMPNDFPGRSTVMNTFYPAFKMAGMGQSWNMFAPNPVNIDSYVTVEAEFKDGTRKTVNLSHMTEFGYFERYRREKWRKWANESLTKENNGPMWKASALFYAKDLESFENPVIKVDLVKHSRSAVIPTKVEPNPKRPDWAQSTFYTLNLDQERS